MVTAGIPLMGAFTSTAAERSVSVAVAEDDAAFLALESSSGANGVYATQDGGTLELRFDGSGTPANGLNTHATTYAADVFTVTNQGTQTVSLTVDAPTDRIAFYASVDGAERRLDADGGVPVSVGEQVNVSVELDTGNGSVLEAVDSVTIAANANANEDAGGGTDDPSDGGGRTVRTNTSDGDVRATGSVVGGQSLDLDLGDAAGSQQDDIAVQSTTINYTDAASLNTTVDVVDAAADGSAPGPALPANTSALTYLEVSHPETPDSAIGNASFRFTLPDDADAEGGSVDLVRYDEADGTWETASTTISYVGDTTEGEVYEARTHSLSLFAVVEAVRGQIVRTNGTLSAVDASLTTDLNTTYPVTAYETYRTQALNASFWEQNATGDADDAAAVIREKLRIDLAQAAKDTAISKFVSYVDGVLKTTIGLSGIGTLLTLVDVARSSGEFATSLGPAIQKQAVAIHVDPGEDSYHELRANLEALEDNSAAYKDATRQSERYDLLEARAALLEDTYRLLPSYLEDVHADVVENTAGGEDPRAYKQIRSEVESLRLLLEKDYRETTLERYNAPKRSLSRTTSMPTHGWVAFGAAEVYDTMDHPDDYLVLRLDASEATADDVPVSVSVTGANASELDATLVSERPNDPQAAEGRNFDSHGFTKVETFVEDPEPTSYVVVEPGDTAGPIRVVADAGSTPVRLSVAERAGPDIQRPHADLVASPEPVTLKDGDVVFPTNDSDADLAWSLWDDKTETDDIDYRLRVDDGTGFTDWSSWQTAPADGRVTPDRTYGEGLTRVQLQVRDDAGRTTTRNADVVVTTGAPQTALAAPDADDPADGEVFVRVLPDSQMKEIEAEYRVNETASWHPLETVTDTENFESVTLESETPPPEGRVEVRARATNVAGETGDWARETLTYDPSGPTDTTPPDVDLEAAPDRERTLVDGEVVKRRVVSTETATLSWSATDARTPDSELTYRVRVDDGSWSAWNDNGDWFEVTPSVSTAGTTVEVEVRDGADNTASRSVTLRRDTDPPNVTVDVTDDVTGAVVNPNGDEPLSTVELQYRAADETEWTDWESVSTDPTDVHLGTAGSFELRARGIDTAGNVGPWTAPVPFDSLPADRSTSLSDSSEELSGGGSVDYDVPNASEVGERAAEGYLLYNALVDQIDGELLLDVYMTARDGSRVQIDEIALTEERNQTVAADLPANFTEADKLSVEARGNGTVVLSSLRAIGPEPEAPPLTASPANATVGADVTLAADGDGFDPDYVDSYEWDVDGDGEYERTTDDPTTTVTYVRSGAVNATLRVTDVFDASVTRSTVVRVNAPPSAAVTGDETIRTGTDASLDAAGTADLDGNVTAYRWDLDGDGDAEQTGETAAVSFPDDGTYSVALTVTDDDGATDTATANVTVLNRRPEAAAGANETEPLVGAPVAFDAADSLDPDGEIERYEWDADGDGEYDRSGEAVVASFEEPGEQTVAVRVTDDDGVTNETTIVVDVNAPPEPAVSLPETVLTGESVTLNGTESTDADGEVVDYAWTAEGSSALHTGALTNASFDDDGTYEVALTVADDDNATATVTRNLTVRNRGPELWLTRVWPETLPVERDGFVEYETDAVDEDGRVVNATLAFTPPSNETRTLNASANGALESQLDESGVWNVSATVTDDDGATTTVNRTLAVNAPPEATVDAPRNATVGEQVEFLADATDPDGSVREYTWRFGGLLITGENATWEPDEAGIRNVTLRVTDDDGATTAVNHTLDVHGVRDAEILAPDVVETGEPVTLRAETVGFDDPIQNYSWTVSNETFAGENATWTPEEPGEREVVLGVTTDDGETVYADRILAVESPYQPDLNVDRVLGGRVLSASAYPDDGYDIEPDDLTYKWDLDGDGDFERDGRQSRDRVVDEPGTYEVAVRVDAPNIPAATERVTITVDDVDPNVTLDWQRTDFGGAVSLTDDTILVGAGEQDGGGESGTIRGLSRSNRSLTWETTLFFNPYQSVIRDDTLYAAGEGVARVDIDTGDVDWSLSALNGSLRTVEGDTVYAAGDGSITALNATTGTKRWSDPVDEYVYGVVAAGDTVVVRGDSSLVARDAATGTVRWNHTWPDSPEVKGVVDGRVLLVENANLTARDVDTGDVAWTQPLPATESYEVGDVTVRDGVAYVESDSWDSPSVTAVATDGEQLWSVQTGDNPGFRVRDDTVYVASSDEVTALDRQTGVAEWTTSLDLDYPSVEWVDDDRVVVDGSGNATVLDAATGDPTWRAETGYVLYASDYSDGTLYVGTAGGIYAVDLEDS